MPLEVVKVDYTYNKGLPQEHAALKNISLKVADNAFVAVVGHTGSGKSTLMQILNGILKPDQGQVLLDGQDINLKNTSLKAIHQQIGLVFQYPEHQLFEETVAKDVAFGPKNMHITQSEINSRVKKALQLVGLDYPDYAKRSPFSLSGGEKRRVAIAGVLAMQPKYLILDEPTAGLDPNGREEIMEAIYQLHKNAKISVILVTHGMEEVAKYASEMHVLHSGKLILSGKPLEIFSQENILKQAGLRCPAAADIILQLRSRGFDLPLTLTVNDAARAITDAWRKKHA